MFCKSLSLNNDRREMDSCHSAHLPYNFTLMKTLVRIAPKIDTAEISFDIYFHFLESDLQTTAVYARFSKQLLNVLPTVKYNTNIREDIIE